MTKLYCVLCHGFCNAVLSLEAMKPSKLKRHLYSKHPQHAGKDLSFFGLKRQKLICHGYYEQQNKALVETSALEIV